jgi:hypothetical protein
MMLEEQCEQFNMALSQSQCKQGDDIPFIIGAIQMTSYNATSWGFR